MEQLKTAVFMPAYEPKRDHIRAAVESVLGQTFSEWTLLINDDASVREDTRSHIADFLVDPRITFCRNPRNLGIGGNWNACWREAPPQRHIQEPGISSINGASPPLPAGAGETGEGVRGVRPTDPRQSHQEIKASSVDEASPPLPLAKGGQGEGVRGVRQSSEYVAFLFHDDLWEPAYLEQMIGALDQHPSAGFAAANHTYIKEGNVPAAPFYDELRDFVQKHLQPGLHNHREFLRWWLERGLRPNVIGEPSFVVLRRSLMEQVGPFNTSMVQFLDSEYWARCLLTADFVYVPQELGKFRVHPAGMSAVNEGIGRGVFERFQTLQTVVAGLPPQERHAANTAIVHALSGMIGKYFARRREGKSVSGHGSGGLKRFVLRHPLLTIRAFVQWMRKKQKQ